MLFLPTVTTELKKGSFTAEGKKTQSFKFPSKQGRNEDTATAASEEEKSRAPRALGSTSGQCGTPGVRHCHLPAHPCCARRMGSCAGMDWEQCFFFLGKGCKVPDPQTTSLLGFCLVIQGDSPSNRPVCHRS